MAAGNSERSILCDATLGANQSSRTRMCVNMPTWLVAGMRGRAQIPIFEIITLSLDQADWPWTPPL